MKKLAAILLLSVHLFNLAGYSLLFQCLIHQSDAQLVKQLDNSSYNDKDLLEIKVPLNMPYISDSKDFERVNGQLEYNGVQYNYVKRKVTADTLYVLCFPNIPKTQLYKAKAIYGKEVSDIPTNKKPSESLKNKAAQVNTIVRQTNMPLTALQMFRQRIVRLLLPVCRIISSRYPNSRQRLSVSHFFFYNYSCVSNNCV